MNEPDLVNTQVHLIIHRYWPVSGSNRKYLDYSAKELEIGYFLYYPQKRNRNFGTPRWLLTTSKLCLGLRSLTCQFEFGS